MVELGGADLVGKGDGNIHLKLVLGLVVAVARHSLGLPVLNARKTVFADDLGDVVYNAVDVIEHGSVKASAVLVAEDKLNARVDNSLALHDVGEIFGRYVDVGKHLEVGLPCDFSARVLFGIGLLFKAADVFALFKMEGVAVAVASDIDVHILGAVLR